MTRPAWIALDWGTSNMRAYAMDVRCNLIDSLVAEKGMSTLAKDDYEPILLDISTPWLGDGPIDVIACGMLGAHKGWIEAPYRQVPCAPDPPTLTKAPTQNPGLNVWIAPGVSQSSPPDVMRGEETQIAGFLLDEPNFDGVICLPGTHTKWVRVSAQEIVSFTTFMTGEIFALLSTQSVLRHTLTTGQMADAPFLEAVSDTISKPQLIASRLFSLRASALLEDLPAETAGARLSGMLIGAELAGARAYWLGMEICIIGPPKVARLYQTALEAQGALVKTTSVEQTTLKGLTAAYHNLKDQL